MEELRSERERETMSKRLHKSMALEKRGSIRKKKRNKQTSKEKRVNQPHRTEKHPCTESGVQPWLMVALSPRLCLFLPVVLTDSELIGKRTMQLWGSWDGITQIINHWANIHCTMAKMHVTYTHTYMQITIISGLVANEGPQGDSSCC